MGLCQLVPHVRVAVLHSSYVEDNLFSVVVNLVARNPYNLSAIISDDQNVLRRIGVSFVSLVARPCYRGPRRPAKVADDRSAPLLRTRPFSFSKFSPSSP